MPIKDSIVNRLRKSSYRAFLKLSRGRGVSRCKLYPATSGNTKIVQRNLYHDIIEETGPGKIEPVDTFIFIDIAPPIKVVKALGWYKEDEGLPMIGYMPYESHWIPEKSAVIVIPEEEGYLAGTWVIEKETAYGQGVSVLWACNIVPKRI